LQDSVRVGRGRVATLGGGEGGFSCKRLGGVGNSGRVFRGRSGTRGW